MRPIYDYLIDRKEIIDFKMPGHKKRLAFNNISKIDETETYGTDNLHNPKGIIKDSMDMAREVYGTVKTLYVVNGSTSALQIGILSQSRPGEDIIIQRNSHMSVYHSLILGRLNPLYLYPQVVGGVPGQIDKDEFEARVKDSKARLVVLTNPSYQGFSSDLKTLIDIAHRNKKLVIVDEAHGAHLPFTSKLIDSAINLGADIVVHSAHKSLPSLTQTSLLHVNSDRVDLQRIYEFSRILQTSSPSYVLMASLEKAIVYLEGQGREKLDEVVGYCKAFHNELKQIPGILIPQTSYHSRDLTKFYFAMEGYSGEVLGKKLYDEYSINMEYTDINYVMGIASLMNEKEDFSKLIRALKDLGEKAGQTDIINNYDNIKSRVRLPIYEAFYRKKSPCPLEDAPGKISGTFIIPYPPGIVILAPGEEISPRHLDLIGDYLKHGIDIINGESLEVIDE